LFFNETKLNKRGSDGKVWTWKKPDEFVKPKHAKQTVKYDYSVMAWDVLRQLVLVMYTCECVMNCYTCIIILSSYMIPLPNRLFQASYIFQHNNDPKHAAKKVKKYLSVIRLLRWTRQSHDLNPIENLWHKLKIQIKSEEIKNVFLQKITTDYCNALIESIPRRKNKLDKNKGLWINY